MKFVLKLGSFRDNLAGISGGGVSVGWMDGAKEKPRSMPKKIKKGKAKGKMSHVKYGPEFTGPMQEAPSLALIARTLCYGRAKGTNRFGHEYPAIPPRNFVRNLQDKHFLKPVFGTFRKEILAGFGKGKTGHVDRAALMEKVGVLAKGAVQRSMRDSNSYAANAPSTIARKGSARPLIDTGNLIRSVDFEVKK